MTTPSSQLPVLPPSDTCVKCGLCLPHCPTYRLSGNENYSPRGRLAAMSAVLHDDAPIDETYDDVLSTCLGCRACEAVCPGLVPYGLAFEAARAELTERRHTVPRRVRQLVLGRVIATRSAVATVTAAARWAQRLGAGRWLPGWPGRGLAGLRPLQRGRTSWLGRAVEGDGPNRGTVALLAGCVMDPWFGPVHDATVGVLTRAGFRVVVPESQTCCGALAAHDGHRREASRMAASNVRAFVGFDHVISNSAGCTAHLKEYDHWATDGAALADRVVDVTEFVALLITQGDLPVSDRESDRVAMQDPCHLRHAQRIVEAPRTIVRAAGHELVEIDPMGLCCGAAGVYSVLQPATSADLGRRKAAQVANSGATVVATANPGCEMQLRAYLGPDVRAAHPVELYWEMLSDGDRHHPADSSGPG